MRILALGDVVGGVGCNALKKALPKLKLDKNIDFCVANGENSADGNGILKISAETLFSIGVDVITGGNHTYRRPEFLPYLDENDFIIRPANFPKDAAGMGSCIYDMGRSKIAVINVMGVVYMDALDSPFDTIDKEIEKAKQNGCNIILVDFHAEATSEKKAMGYYVDGRVSAIFGTHTHIQTNDLQIFENGTGYITDLGMCGSMNGILGVKTESIIHKFMVKTPNVFEAAEGNCKINGAYFEIDEKTGKCLAAQRVEGD